VYMSGAPIGSMLSPLLLAPIIARTSWQISFYFIALLGCILVLLISLLVWNAPNNRKCDGDKSSRYYIRDLKQVVLNKQFQVIVVAFTALQSVWWGISLWLPTYLVKVQGLSISKMSYAASFPYIGAILGLYFGSWISNITGKRKSVIVISLISVSLMLLILTSLNIRFQVIALVLLSTIFFVGMMTPGIFFTILQSRVPKRIVGSATGIMNGIGNGLGFLGPVVVGSVVGLTGSYNAGLGFLGGIALVGGLVFQFSYKPLESGV